MKAKFEPTVVPPANHDAAATAPNRQSSATFAALAQWNIRQMILAILTVLAVAAGFLLLYRFYMVVFLLFVAISLKVALEPATVWLQRRGIHRVVGVLLIYLLLFLAIALLIALIAPSIVAQTRTVMADLPGYYSAARVYLMRSGLGLLRGVARLLPADLSWPILIAASSDTVEGGLGAWYYINLVGRTLFVVLSVFVLAYYFTLEGDLILRKLVMRMPVERRQDLRNLIDEINHKIGVYFRGQIVLCLIVGGFSLLAFLLIGVPNAAMLALLMGIFEAIPVIGPLLGAIPAVLMTVATAPERTPWVIGALALIQLLENNLLVPRVMDESVGVNAIVSMLAIAAFGALFGFAGALLAIPLAAIVQILMNRLLFESQPMDDQPEGGPGINLGGRSRLDVVRLEARELALDVRKQTRMATDAEPWTDGVEWILDEVEAIATELDNALAPVEAR